MTSYLTSPDRISALRLELGRLGVDGFIVPHADEYQSEYTRPSSERLDWLTGFSGSAGVAVVLPELAACLSDGRYTLQLAEQVDDRYFERVDITRAGIGDWLLVRGEAGQVIGYDPHLHTPKQIKDLTAKISGAGLSLKALPYNPIDVLWHDRVLEEPIAAEVFPDSLAGRSSIEKRTAIAAQLKEKGISSAIIMLADSIAWLLNVRGQDIPYNPVVLSYVILHADDARIDWFVDERKMTPDVRRHLGNSVTIHPETDIAQALKGLKGIVQVDYERCSQWFVQELSAADVEIRDGMDPAVTPKSLKTPEEREGMRLAHLRDGIALTKFLYWFHQIAPSGQITEMDVEKKLKEFRQQQPGYRMDSFDTIAGWAHHGAIVHYRVTPQTNIRIEGNGLFLLDSGGQYQSGTTDITRTVGVGSPTVEMRDRFTRVMKGHIAVAMLKFPEGTTGVQIDMLARAPLWEVNADFAHGTGHGVGCYLCVHEESARLSPRVFSVVKPHMIVSNEPGYYQDGAFGIRCENLILSYETDQVCNDGRKMLAFETISLVPFDCRLLDASMLTSSERAWLEGYHHRTFEALSPFLAEEEKVWFKEYIQIK